jgi:hypothetical protein
MVEGKAQLTDLENRARDQRAKVQSAEAKMKAWVEEKKTATSEKIAAWKAQHDVKKLAAYADSAEDFRINRRLRHHLPVIHDRGGRMTPSIVVPTQVTGFVALATSEGSCEDTPK